MHYAENEEKAKSNEAGKFIYMNQLIRKSRLAEEIWGKAVGR
jgi:hypothetical protein